MQAFHGWITSILCHPLLTPFLAYNGRTMSHYTLYENQSYAKTGGLVTNLYATSDSRLLAFDNKGNIFVYHRALNRFIPYLESFTTLFRQLEAKASGLALNNLMIDNSSQVWISTNQGVFKIKLHNVSVVRWDMNSNVNGVIVCGNHYVAYTDQGAYVIDPETGKSLKQLSNERKPSEQTSVKFDNLPAGQYTLVVRSVSRNSGRIIDTQSLTINVAAPWYFSTLAWMIYLLLAASGMTYLWRVAYQRGRASHSSAVPSQQS